MSIRVTEILDELFAGGYLDALDRRGTCPHCHADLGALAAVGLVVSATIRHHLESGHDVAASPGSSFDLRDPDWGDQPLRLQRTCGRITDP